MALLTAPKADRPSRGKSHIRRDAVPREADASLMVGLLQREPWAAAAFYDRYASRIYGLGLVLLGNKTDAEDLVQDTILKVWRRGSSFDPQRGSLDAWILLNARSLAVDARWKPGACRPVVGTRTFRTSSVLSRTRCTAT